MNGNSTQTNILIVIRVWENIPIDQKSSPEKTSKASLAARPGVLLKIWLKQGKEKRLLARKKDCWQGF